MAEAGEAHLRIWAKEDIISELLHSVVVQRGGALSYLYGYEQALRKLRVTEGVVAAKNAADDKRGEELLGDENGEDAASAA